MSNLTPEIFSSFGMTSCFSCLTMYWTMSGVILPSAMYGVWNMIVSQPYSRRSSSNHFMKVKQPVYESSRTSGFGRRLPFGPMLPFAIMPMSDFT